MQKKWRKLFRDSVYSAENVPEIFTLFCIQCRKWEWIFSPILFAVQIYLNYLHLMSNPAKQHLKTTVVFCKSALPNTRILVQFFLIAVAHIFPVYSLRSWIVHCVNMTSFFCFPWHGLSPVLPHILVKYLLIPKRYIFFHAYLSGSSIVVGFCELRLLIHTFRRST